MDIASAGVNALKNASGGRIATSVFAAALIAGAAPPAAASGPQFTFAGRISQSTPPLPPPWQGVGIGDEWEMTICLDPRVPDLCVLPDRGCYPAGLHVQMRIGGVVQTITSPASALITIIDSPPPRGDGLLVSFRLDDVLCTLTLTDSTGAAFASTLLPECSSIPAAGFWTTAQLAFDPPGPGEATGRMTRVICTPRLPCGPCPDCPTDYNQDGGIDGGDVGAFFADWEAGLPCADVNRDGGVDNGDVSRFFRLWENGICCFGSPDYDGDGDLNCNDLCEFHADLRLGRRCADINADGIVDDADASQFIADYIRAGGTGCASTGDFNLDGRVNCADVCLFHRAFAAGDLAADVNCDGDVSTEDLIAFDRAYSMAGGPPCPQGADFNLDGNVDCADACAFNRALQNGALAADYNCDGTTDLEDAILFREAFEEAGGPVCPDGADFNRDGRIDCRDLGLFNAAFAAGDSAADLNCSGTLDAADQRRFFTDFLDLSRDGQLTCRDLCIQLERVNAQRPAADMNCDGTIDLEDVAIFQSLFGTYYTGPSCVGCP